MDHFTFIKDYKDNPRLRGSFNHLAMETFGIGFEDWYLNGYWTNKYIPYSLVNDYQIVANVSVNILTIILNGEEVPAIQIGTVMTDKEHRNKGYSRLLMEKVLEDYAHIPFMYLFANHSVLNFYPKFGFAPMKETLFSCDYTCSEPNTSGCLKLDGTKQKDLEFIYEKVLSRVQISDVFSTKGTEELAMFYALKVFQNDCYWIQEENALVMCQLEGKTLHIYDIISNHEINITNVLDCLADKDTEKATFYFTPNFKNLNYMKEEFIDTTSLFVRTTRKFNFPFSFKHPITSQA